MPYPEADCPRITHPFATRALAKQALPLPCDLHVLSAPPAFVLSQDQTLHVKKGSTNHADARLAEVLEMSNPVEFDEFVDGFDANRPKPARSKPRPARYKHDVPYSTVKERLARPITRH